MSRKDDRIARDARAAEIERDLDSLRAELDASKRERSLRAPLSGVDLASVLGAFSVSLIAALKVDAPNQALIALTGELEALAREGDPDHPANRTIALIAQFIEATTPDD